MQFKVFTARILLSILCFGANPNDSFARSCEGDNFGSVSIGSTVEFKQKVKIDVVCTRVYRSVNLSFVETEFISYPKEVFKFVARPYEFAFSMKKLGLYQIGYRIKVRDSRSNKIGYLNFKMNVEVVPKSW